MWWLKENATWKENFSLAKSPLKQVLVISCVTSRAWWKHSWVQCCVRCWGYRWSSTCAWQRHSDGRRWSSRNSGHQSLRSPWATGSARSSRSSCSCGAWRWRSTPPKPNWTTSSGTTAGSGASTTTASSTASARFTTRAPRRARARAPWTDPCAFAPSVPAFTRGARASGTGRAVRCARPWRGCASTGAKRTACWRSSGWETSDPQLPFTSLL